MRWCCRDLRSSATRDRSAARHARCQVGSSCAVVLSSNRFLLPDLVAAVVNVVPAGASLTSMPVSGCLRSRWPCRRPSIVAVEGDRLASDDLKTNARSAEGTMVARHQSVETFLAIEGPPSPHAAIADPPRTGLSKDALRCS